VSWALNDDDARVRRAAAKTLPKLAKADTRIATILSERALSDSDSQVRISAVKAIRSLDKDSGRARELILKGASSTDVEVRRACVEMLPILYGEDVLRGIAIDLLKTETDLRLIKSLKDYATDDSLEGSEAQKNRFLAPAPAIPKLDREVAEAAGKSVGLEPIKPSNLDKVDKQNETTVKKPKPKVTDLYKSVSQDDMMGYYDDDY
ncbi:MAG: HEAT repeat domain-containing protein, partial [Candidatus Thermoplasmatota archaeon]|nr:HEAT repeat domain-containing protein [Candidatus Thermoplasmatota archaeon]